MSRIKVGIGATVTQGTSKSTAVTCDSRCGQITTHNASLAAATSVGFTVNNVHVDADDTVVVCFGSGNTAASYTVGVDAMAVGSFKIHLRNESGGSLSEAIVINFSVIKNFF